MQSFNRIFRIILNFLLPLSRIDRKVAEITSEILAERISYKKFTYDGSDYISTLFDYRDILIKHMIWSLKYKRNRRAAKVFGSVLNDYLAEELSDLSIFSNFTEPLFIPIPLSRKRFRQRGFNQTELIAQELSLASEETLCTICTDVLKRIKDTPSQTSLKDKQARIENMKGVFSIISPEKIKGRNIIVLDDVTTTGATLSEARKMLLEAGAKQVLCIALAH